MKVHFPARYQAEGGPAFDGPSLPLEHLDQLLEWGAVSLIVLPGPHDRPSRFAVIDANGNILAEADSAYELTHWLDQYAEALDEEMERVFEDNRPQPKKDAYRVVVETPTAVVVITEGRVEIK